MVVGVFKKQRVYWIDYYVKSRRKRARIGPDKRLTELALENPVSEVSFERKHNEREHVLSPEESGHLRDAMARLDTYMDTSSL
jgi:DNA-directed RNA polymerase specialized sigma24 family protein